MYLLLFNNINNCSTFYFFLIAPLVESDWRKKVFNIFFFEGQLLIIILYLGKICCFILLFYINARQLHKKVTNESEITNRFSKREETFNMFRLRN